MSADAFGSYERKWLAAHPENAVLGIFLAEAQRARNAAFGTLVHELSQAALHAREPQAAAIKLAWWRQELADAASGKARHPITQALFAEAGARETDAALWPTLAEGALTQLDLPPASTLQELIEQFDMFFGPIARAEAALLCGGAGNAEANAALWTLSHLLHELPGLATGDARLPLPLALLARHEIARADLDKPSPRRNTLIKDFLDDLALETNGALGVASVRTLALRVRTRLDAKRIARALRVTDPLAYLQQRPHPGRWSIVWTTWREARAAAHALDS
jgi:phytoene synthase